MKECQKLLKKSPWSHPYAITTVSVAGVMNQAGGTTREVAALQMAISLYIHNYQACLIKIYFGPHVLFQCTISHVLSKVIIQPASQTKYSLR